jgi:type II secretory pathway pseudopilin PulG
MKSFLKALLFVVIGAAAGAVITGFLLEKYFRRYKAELYAMNAAANVLLAHQLKDGDAAIVLASAERGIVNDVLILSANDDLKNTPIAEISLKASKRFYVCTKTEIPSEIASIMNALPPVEMADCVVN